MTTECRSWLAKNTLAWNGKQECALFGTRQTKNDGRWLED